MFHPLSPHFFKCQLPKLGLKISIKLTGCADIKDLPHQAVYIEKLVINLKCYKTYIQQNYKVVLL